MNKWYVFRVLWRFTHVTSRIWLLVLLWTVVGGMFLVLFVFITFVIFYYVSNRSYSNIAKKTTIEYYQEELQTQSNKLSQLELSLIELKKEDDWYTDIVQMFAETSLADVKKEFGIAQFVVSHMPFIDDSDDIDFLENFYESGISGQRLSNYCVDIICDVLSKIVLFFMFHLIGVRWTLDTFDDLPIYHIFHRSCEDIFAFILILLFTFNQFNCNLSIDLCANYNIRNIYDNGYVLISIIIFTSTALTSPLFFGLIETKVHTIKQDCDWLIHLMNGFQVELICDPLFKKPLTLAAEIATTKNPYLYEHDLNGNVNYVTHQTERQVSDDLVLQMHNSTNNNYETADGTTLNWNSSVPASRTRKNQNFNRTIGDQDLTGAQGDYYGGLVTDLKERGYNYDDEDDHEDEDEDEEDSKGTGSFHQDSFRNRLRGDDHDSNIGYDRTHKMGDSDRGSDEPGVSTTGQSFNNSFNEVFKQGVGDTDYDSKDELHSREGSSNSISSGLFGHARQGLHRARRDPGRDHDKESGGDGGGGDGGSGYWFVDIDEIFEGIEYGDVNFLQQLESEHFDITNQYGDTPLIVAAKNGQLKVIEFLLKQKPAICNANDEIDQKHGTNALMELAKFRFNYHELISFPGHTEYVDIETTIKLFIKDHGVDVNKTDNAGNTALILAAYAGNVKVVRSIVNICCNNDIDLLVDAQNNKGNSAVMSAIRNANADIVDILVKAGADLSLRNKQGNTAVLEAAGKGHVAILQILHEYGAKFDVKSDSGYTPLLLAVQNKEVSGINYLLNPHHKPLLADVNEKHGETGETALILSVQRKIGGKFAFDTNRRCVKALLKKDNINVNAKDNKNVTALITATVKNNIEAVKLLLQYSGLNAKKNKSYDEFYMYSNYRDDSDDDINIDDLLSSKNPKICDVNAVDGQGATALIWAAVRGHNDAIKLLFKYRKDIDTEIVDNYGHTAVTEAICKGNVDTLKLLKEFGAKFNVRNTNSGQNALIIAASYGKMSTIKYLLNEFDNPPVFDANDQDSQGCTVLMYCRNNTKALKSVLTNYLNNVNYESKIDLEIVNKYGNTVLLEAAHAGNVESVKFLTKCGARLGAMNKYNETILIKAARHRNTALIDFILKQKQKVCDINGMSTRGYTPLMVAVKHGNLDVVKRLLENGASSDAKSVPDESKPYEWVSLLSMASRHGGTEMTKFLIDEAKICEFDEIVDGNGNKAMMLATQANNVELMKYLISKDRGPVDKTIAKNLYRNKVVHGSNNLNQTPLFFGGSGNAVDAMKHLLSNFEIDVSMKDKNGDTTFHYAAMTGSFDAIKYLYENHKDDIDINEMNNKGETALMMVRKKNYAKIAEYLLQKIFN